MLLSYLDYSTPTLLYGCMCMFPCKGACICDSLCINLSLCMFMVRYCIAYIFKKFTTEMWGKVDSKMGHCGTSVSWGNDSSLIIQYPCVGHHPSSPSTQSVTKIGELSPIYFGEGRRLCTDWMLHAEACPHGHVFLIMKLPLWCPCCPSILFWEIHK